MTEEQKQSARYEDTLLADYSEDNSLTGGHADLPFAMLTLLLLAVGVIMVLSASYARAYYVRSETQGSGVYYFTRQLIFAVAGVIVMFICSRLPMMLYRRFSLLMMFVSILLLLLVLVIGRNVNGSTRWIDLGFTTFQPSEITKISLILFFSSRLGKRDNGVDSLRGMIPYILWLGAVFGLLLFEPHYSAIIIIGLVALSLLYVGGVKGWWFVLGFAAVAVAAYVVYTHVDYVQNRVNAWLDPLGSDSDSWQIRQSLYAVGSGGLTGLGLGNSRAKYLYLPEEHNDFIFAIVCEELGFIGAALILALFAVLVCRGYWISMHARNRFEMLVGVGISTKLAAQVAMNVAVCTNAIPCTGISLPLFSYGGTALLIQMAEMGIMLSISRNCRERTAK